MANKYYQYHKRLGDNITKNELIGELSLKCAIDLNVAKFFLESFIDIVKNNIVNSEKIFIAKLGTFELRKVPPRKYHNCYKREFELSEPKMVVKFTPSLDFKNKVKKLKLDK